jgi:phosphoglucosamine mutase
VNINQKCGSTHIEALCELVRREQLDIGFAFDGDADRCIAVDERGEEVNGDKLLYLLARRLRAEEALAGETVVVTVMSNLGLCNALEEAGIQCLRTPVGDRFVYEAMQRNGYCLGGEQSGHVILSKYATTGDGILTALKVMEAMIASKTPLSRLVEPVKMLPQVTENLRVADKTGVMENAKVQAAVAAAKARLGENGRVLLRRSGTEPMVRVMVEAENESICRACIAEVVAAISAEGLL